MVRLASILFRSMDKFTGAELHTCLIGMGVGIPEEALRRMIDSTMLELECDTLGINDMIKIGVGSWRRNDYAKNLLKRLPEVPI